MKYENMQSEISEAFLPHKVSTYSLIESYKRLGMSERADKVRMCGTFLQFIDSSAGAAEHKLVSANFCKDRLCWTCAWRRTLKVFGQVSRVMDKLESEENFRYVFLTLTFRNCSGELLPQTLDKMAAAFNLFSKRAPIKKAFKGAFRTFEITYHPENPMSIQYHPHIHVIYAVRPSYFQSRYYLRHDEIMTIWRECMKLAYDPMVDIRIVRPSIGEDGEIRYKQAIAEVAKYAVKPCQIYVGRTDDEIDDAVWNLTSALSGRRLCSFLGVFKTAAAQLKLDDMVDGDLVNTDNKQLRQDVYDLLFTWRWREGFGFEQSDVRYLTEEDYKDGFFSACR